MECEHCNNIVGRNYRGVGVILCNYCATPFDTTGLVCTYEGKQGDYHSYRVHPVQYCSECGHDLFRILNPCGKIDYGEEMEQLFGVNVKSSRTY
jgi:hypothetical protein